MDKCIEINNRKIGDKYPPYIIAELSANHNGSLQQALQMMEQAKECGVDAIKLQTYTPQTMTIECDHADFKISQGLWQGHTLYELYDLAHTPWKWHKDLFAKAKQLDITIFSTPFDHLAVDFLESLNPPAYKIASFEITDLALIQKVASLGKPMIISTGMANYLEIQEAVLTAKDSGCKDLILLHCISGYPTPIAESNLRTIIDLKQKFSTIVGLSDHTLSNTTSIAAVALGAQIIEKHFVTSRQVNTPDAPFSLEPHEFCNLVKDCNAAWNSLGEINYALKKSEEENISFRRSIYIVADMKKGDIFTPNNLRSIRPGYGLKPKYLNQVLGKKAAKDVNLGTALKWELIAN